MTLIFSTLSSRPPSIHPGLLNPPVDFLARAPEVGADFVSTDIVADRDDIVETLASFEKVKDALRTVISNIDADLRHHPDCKGMHAVRFRSGAESLIPVAGKGLQQTLRHLRTG